MSLPYRTTAGARRIRRASAYAPATVANVGPGFDAFGFALEGPGDVVTAVRVDRPGVRIATVSGAKLPMSPSRNAAGAVAAAMLVDAVAPFGAELHIEKGLSVGTGMGSSSASSAAAAVAVNALLGGRYDESRLVAFAAEGERAASGAAHADNVAAAILGGFTIVPPSGPVDVMRIAMPRSWTAAVARPRIEVATRTARMSLPRSVPFTAAMAHAAGASSLIAALARKDILAFGRAMSSDAIVEPVRARAIPGYAEVRAAAFAAGAVGVAVSGSGPSLVALTVGKRHAKVVAEAMRRAWAALGVESDLFVSRAGAPGARSCSLQRR